MWVEVKARKLVGVNHKVLIEYDPGDYWQPPEENVVDNYAGSAEDKARREIIEELQDGDYEDIEIISAEYNDFESTSAPERVEDEREYDPTE